MGENSKIEWCDHTFNPWIGCSKVSAGCQNCYAENMMDKRLGKAQWGDGGTRARTSAAYWKQPLKWNREAERTGTRARVFCASLADVFEDRPECSLWRADLFRLIRSTPNLDWLILTKRPENIIGALRELPRFRDYGADATQMEWEADWRKGVCPDNVWIGTSVENQEQADKRIPELLKVPAKVRFLSMEPLLGPIQLPWEWLERDDINCDKGFRQGSNMEFGYCAHCAGHITDPIHVAPHRIINWVICGGESGHNARPMHPEWAQSLRDQCQAAGVPFFFKQWGEWLPLGQLSPSYIDDDPEQTRFPVSEWNGRIWGVPWFPAWDQEVDENNSTYRVGKHAAGRLLDGHEWNEFPEVQP